MSRECLNLELLGFMLQPNLQAIGLKFRLAPGTKVQLKIKNASINHPTPSGHLPTQVATTDR